jgi:sulfate adenylyltransferase subunit 2
VESGWDFAELIAHRDRTVAAHGLELRVRPPRCRARPVHHPTPAYIRAALTAPLVQALDAGAYEAVIGGGRRDEERARAKERFVSIRQGQRWDPAAQRPEFFGLHNLAVAPGEHARIFPLSDWTEADIWAYAAREAIPLVPLYFAAMRPTVLRGGQHIVVDDPARMAWLPGETPSPRVYDSVRWAAGRSPPPPRAAPAPSTTSPPNSPPRASPSAPAA